MEDNKVTEAINVIEDNKNIEDIKVIKPQQFKIETPIGSVESDSGNHLIDIGSVVVVIVVFLIVYKLIKKWK